MPAVARRCDNDPAKQRISGSSLASNCTRRCVWGAELAWGASPELVGRWLIEAGAVGRDLSAGCSGGGAARVQDQLAVADGRDVGSGEFEAVVEFVRSADVRHRL